ncbi:hypothetical protein BJF79_03860 [Actinomadura sp. CNU-125]|uniref:hypothetical protein n=1 Tax=Actinomadura sp. CNU-125 TaxID=1904961 RepID=UPI0009691197|nr:hypothetical protein [Actinomadura sp. CNU-125]OLT13045.1 hypothetical protein BJF79_03860 [Actinomadura sp. CNU-125]
MTEPTTPNSPHIIRVGQVYEPCQPTFVVDGMETYTWIRVLSKPIGTPGLYGFGKVQVATITPEGREVRPRRLAVSELHASGTTKHGERRRTGYRLISDPLEGEGR